MLETILFLWLSPGMLFTFPPINGKWFNTDTTSPLAVLVHAAIFAVALYLLGFGPNRKEGFQTQTAPETPAPARGNKRRLLERQAELQYFGAV